MNVRVSGIAAGDRGRGEVLPLNRPFDRSDPGRQLGDKHLDRLDDVAIGQFAFEGNACISFDGMSASRFETCIFIRASSFFRSMGLVT